MNRSKMKLCTLLVLAVMCSASQVFSQVINITTDRTQLVMRVKDNQRLYQSYLGARLSEGTDLSKLSQPAISPSSSGIKGWEVYPVMGTEDYYEPALEITHADGNPTSVLKYVSHSQEQVEGGEKTVIHLMDSLYQLSVDLHYLAYTKENVIKQWSEITHQEKGKVFLSHFASGMLYFESPHYYLTHYTSDWIKEMGMQQEELTQGKKLIDSRLGSRAAMFSQPFFMVSLGSPASEDKGTVLLGTIGWTGNFRFTFEVDHNQGLRVVSGINPDASRYQLPKGEVFRTPEFYYTLSQEGIGQGSRDLQRWALKYQLYKGQEDRMTLLNNWENTYFSFDEEKLTHLFGEAKDLGVDLFLLDDGWFGNKYPRNNDHAGLGDWEANREKLPNGVPYLVEKAHENGVKFGIWIEPEMVNPKSELAEKHPDWILKLPQRDTYYFRNQLVLDLSNSQVQDHVFGVVDRLMTENPGIAFMKWDCNSPITNIYSPYLKERQGNLYIDYVRGLYQVLQRVQRKYPELRMMLCSGGGARCDYEALRYFTEFWCSDNTDPVSRLYIQWGFSQFLPAKAMCAHVTNWNSKASMKFRVDVAFSCKLGFDINLGNMNAEDKQYCQLAIREYERLKPVIFSPDLYRLVSPYESDHCVLQRVDEEKGHALVFAYDLHPRLNENILPVRLKGLDPEGNYRVNEILLMPGRNSSLRSHGQVYSGSYLMNVGLHLLSASEMRSCIVEFVRE